jgi:hypothetical protein
LLYLQLLLCVFDSLHPEINMTWKEDDSLIAVCKEAKKTMFFAVVALQTVL